MGSTSVVGQFRSPSELTYKLEEPLGVIHTFGGIVELTYDFWYLFPASILIATLAMAAGIGGVVFFSPIFLLFLKLEPDKNDLLSGVF